MLTQVTSEKYCDSVLKPDHEIKSEINWSYSASKKGNKIIILKIKKSFLLQLFFCDFSASRARDGLCYISFVHLQIRANLTKTWLKATILSLYKCIHQYVHGAFYLNLHVFEDILLYSL